MITVRINHDSLLLFTSSGWPDRPDRDMFLAEFLNWVLGGQQVNFTSVYKCCCYCSVCPIVLIWSWKWVGVRPVCHSATATSKADSHRCKPGRESAARLGRKISGLKKCHRMPPEKNQKRRHQSGGATGSIQSKDLGGVTWPKPRNRIYSEWHCYLNVS